MSTKPSYGFAYQRDRINRIKCFADQVLVDSLEASQCMELEAQSADLVTAYDWVFETDLTVRTAFLTGKMEYDPSFEQAQNLVLESLCEVAKLLDTQAKRFESTTPPYKVVGVEGLRKRLQELTAILNPSEFENEEAAAEAIEQHRRGEIEEFPK